jgi:thioredoxin-like negative regulator of GroEL
MLFLTSEDELKITNSIQALYFYAPWLGLPHRKMMTMIGKVSEKHQDIEFIGVDSDQFKGLCKRFNIESIPTVVLLKDGVELKRITGMVLTSAFRSIFADICNSES